MPIVTKRQRFGLILFGVFLTFIFLEIALGLGGWVFLLRQEHLNRKSTFKENEIRVLCLGESTTAIGGENAYPFQLQEILQQERPDKKWVVINGGRVSKTSADILADLDGNLARYRPQIVVTMIGINDRPLLPPKNSFSARLRKVLRHSHVYYLFELLSQHLAQKFSKPKPAEGVSVLPQTSDLKKLSRLLYESEKAVLQQQVLQKRNPLPDEEFNKKIARLRYNQVFILIGIAEISLSRGNLIQAEKAMEAAMTLAPDNYSVLVETARCYRMQGACGKAIPLLKRANQIQPDMIGGWVDLGRCYADLGQDEEALATAREILKKKNEEFWYYPDIGEWLHRRGHLAEAERFYLEAIRRNDTSAQLYEKLAQIYAEMGKKDLADEYQRQAAKRQKNSDAYMPETVDNYRRIGEKVLTKGAALVVMQYPRRRLEPLKEIFPWDWPVYFVENQTNFEAAFAAGGTYADYFADNFAGDFGHCKRPGNALIARQLAEVISKQVFK